MMPTTRLETFSDGVIAIAATLLILDVHASGSPLGKALVHIWPSYLAYALSFTVIGIIWVNHHAVIGQLGQVDRRFLFINLFFLMVVAFIPFPTQLVAENIRHGGTDARDAVLAYGVTCTMMAVAYNVMWFYAIHERRLLKPDADPKVVASITSSFRPGIPIYFGATLLAFASPALSLSVFGALALFYVFEGSFFARNESPS
ncbi:MAG TPA: TMEM175 family protein [Thermoleophilaceae bacterium]